MDKIRLSSLPNKGTVSESERTSEVFKEVALVFFTTHLAIYLLSVCAHSLFNGDFPEGHPLLVGITPSSSPLLRVWERWDSMHYLSILEHGYTFIKPGVLNTAFFPLYPMLGFLVNGIIGNPTISLLLVSNAASFFALVFVYKLVAREYKREWARRTIFYLSIFPHSFIFVGIYTESLFLLSLAATLYYARNGEWVLAAVWGISLTATRLVGVAVLPALLWEYMQDRNWDIRRIDFKSLAIGSMVLGLLGYMLYTYIAFGDFLSLFHSSAQGWNRQLEWPWITWQNHVERTKQEEYNPILIVTSFFTILGVVLAVLSFKWLHRRDAILATAMMLIPLSSNQMFAMPRYLLVNLPLFLVLTRLGEHRAFNMVIVVLSLLFLGFFTMLHANWLWVG